MSQEGAAPEEARAENEEKGRRWWLWGGVGAVAFLCICTLIFGLVGGNGDENEATSVAVQEEPTDTEPPATATETLEPSETPTREPTSTPRPTDTPAPPTATPEPVTIQGSGQDVTDAIQAPSGVSLATFTYEGAGNFIVIAFGPDGGEDLLVNDIGSYAGTRPLFGEGEWFFDVTASGPWTIEISAVAVQEDVLELFEGNGDDVSGLFLPPAGERLTYEFTHDGQSNFVVYLHCAGGSDLLQNEIGAADNAAVVSFTEAPCLWEVEADGAWTISPR